MGAFHDIATEEAKQSRRLQCERQDRVKGIEECDNFERMSTIVDGGVSLGVLNARDTF